MKRTFLLSFLLLPYLLFGQAYIDNNSYCEIIPFYDYSVCLKGIKSKDSTILIEPRFTDIQILPMDLLLVNVDGYYGVMNCELEYILPPVYLELSWFESFWQFKGEHGYGILNKQFDTIVPPIFDFIRRIYPRRDDEDKMYYLYKNIPQPSGDSISFFQAHNGANSGIYREDGERIVPPNYQLIKFKGLITGVTPELPDGRYFVVNDSASVRMYSTNGDELLKDTSATTIYASAIGKSNSSDTSTIAWVGNGRNQQTKLFNLSSNKAREEFRYNNILKGNLIVSTYPSRNSHILNSDLETIYSCKPGITGINFFVPNRSDLYKISIGHSTMAVINESGSELIPLGRGNIHYTNSNGIPLIWREVRDNYRRIIGLQLYSMDGDSLSNYTIDDLHIYRFFEDRIRTCNMGSSDELLFIASEGKWGALDHRGKQVIPFIYDNYGVTFSQKKCDSIQGYYVTKESKKGIIDSKGKVVHPFKYEDIQLNFTGDISLFKRKGLFELRNSEDKVLLKKCDTVFLADITKIDLKYSMEISQIDSGLIGGTEFYPFAIAGDELYTLHNGNFQLCDSTILNFNEPLFLIKGLLITKSGKIILTPSDGELNKTKHFYLNINDSIAEIVSLHGSKKFTIENFKSAQVEGDFIKVKLRDEKIGLLKQDGSEWLFPPTYYDITFGTDFPNKVWVKTTPIQFETGHRNEKRFKSIAGEWKLIDLSGNDLLDFQFKYPPFLYDRPTTIFESGGKFGIIDSNFTILIAPEQEFIRSTDNSEIYAVFNNSSWSLIHLSGVQLPGEYSSLSFNSFNHCNAVFQFTESDTLIGVVTFNNGFEWIIPLTEIHEAAELYSFEEKLKIGNYEDHHYSGLAINQLHPTHWRVQNNEQLINFYLHGQFNLQTARDSHGRYGMDFEWQTRSENDPDASFFEDVSTIRFPGAESIYYPHPPELLALRKTIRKPQNMALHYTNKQVFSRWTTPGTTPWPESNSSYRTYDNFLFIDSAKRVNLYDLVEDASKTQDFIFNFITKEFNKIQAFQTECPDINKLTESAETDFCFTKGGIRLVPTFSYSLFLPYDELLPYLKPEVKALGGW